MPKTIKDEESGEEIEVYSKEELEAAAEAKAAEERERLEAEKEEALEAANAEKEELETKLKKFEDKDYNFSKLREKKNKNEDGESQEEIQKKIDELNQKIDAIGNQSKEDTLNDFIKNKVGEDKETKEKFDYYYKRLGSDAKSKEEIQKAATEALQLATGGSYQPDRDQSMHSVGANQNYRQQNTGEPSEQAKEIGSKLGVSDEDRKKYGKKK